MNLNKVSIMKNLIYTLIAAIFWTMPLFGQAPYGFNYQAVIRDVNGDIVSNEQVTITIAILKGGADGTEVYSEEFTPTTNEWGLVTLAVGSTDPAAFAAINWADGPYYVKINDNVLNSCQLLSVPYALYAKTAEMYTETDPVFAAHPTNSITGSDIGNWNEAYSWGNHADAGYLTTVALDDLSDVSVTSPQTNQVLKFNGTTWVNSAVSGSGGDDGDWTVSGDDIYSAVTGNVGIGVSNPSSKLSVNGDIACKEVTVTMSGWPDFVFAEGYDLPSLSDIDQYIKDHNHLPGVPTAGDINNKGVKLGDMNAILLQKVEELTLYVIKLEKENETLKNRVTALEEK